MSNVAFIKFSVHQLCNLSNTVCVRRGGGGGGGVGGGGGTSIIELAIIKLCIFITVPFCGIKLVVTFSLSQL